MIVLLGGTGFVGSRIAVALDAVRLPYRVLRRRELDYYQPSLLEQFLRTTDASFLINAAGFTGRPNVDACERQKSECLLGNAVLPGVVSQACEVVGVPFGHVSSGCIYRSEPGDGSGFSESDPPNFCFRNGNCSFYSGAKALGEEVLADCDTCYIWRLRIPFNHLDSPRNYLSKLLRYDRLLDVRNSLTHLDQFAMACVDCIERRVPFGTYNMTNGGSVTTRQVVRMLAEYLVPHHEFRFFRDEAEFMRDAAIAPRSHCVLDNSKALAAGLVLSPIENALRHAIAQWQPMAPVRTSIL